MSNAVLKPPPRRPPRRSSSNAHTTFPVDEAKKSLRDFVQKQVGVTKRMQQLSPPPSEDELRAHASRVATTVRRIVSGTLLDEKAFVADVEACVARPIACSRTMSQLVDAVTESAAFCHRKASLSAEAESETAAVSAMGTDVCHACERLWELDVNRLTPGVDYEVDLQGLSKGYAHDAAPKPLFRYVADDVWKKPTFKLFYPLLSHYHAQTGSEEIVSRLEIDQQRLFLAAICATPCMRFAHRWLVENEKVSPRVRDAREFQEMLSEMWFGLYRRESYRDSSAFEHVFAGEIDDGQVKGMHNFLQVYKEERAGNFNFKGYLLPRPKPNSLETPSASSHLLTIRFDWLDVTKAASSVLLGTSPEFEIALYTMLFIAGERENKVHLGPYLANVKVYPFGSKLGSAYPEALPVSLEDEVEEATVTLQTAIRRRREEDRLEARKETDAELGEKIEKLLRVGGRIGNLLGLF